MISEKNAGRATDPRRRAGPARLAQGAHRPPPAPPRPLRRPLRRRRGRPGLAGGGDGGARIVREQHLRSSISSRAEVRVAEGGGGGGGGAPVQLAEGQRRRAEGQPRNQHHHQHRHQQQQHRQQRRPLWAALPVAAGLAAPREPLAAGARRGGAGGPRRVLSAVQVLFCHSPFFAFVHYHRGKKLTDEPPSFVTAAPGSPSPAAPAPAAPRRTPRTPGAPPGPSPAPAPRAPRPPPFAA